MDKKSNSAFWLEAIGILVGGFSLFSLTNSIVEFGLSDIFDRITAIYRSIFHPIVGVIEPLISWISDRAGWAIPPAWQDFVVFYLIVAGAVTRVHARNSGRWPGVVRLFLAIFSGLSWVFVLVLFPLMLVLSKDIIGTLRSTYSHYKEVVLQILYAFLALFGFLALNAYGS